MNDSRREAIVLPIRREFRKPNMIKKAISKALLSVGYTLVKHVEYPCDLSPADIEIYKAVKAFTMTSVERVAALINAITYIVSADVPGPFVECGVWRGGSMMAAARTLIRLGALDRDLYLFDTYDGMPEPEAFEINFLGESAPALLSRAKGLPRDCQLDSHVLALCPLESVKANMASVGYPAERTHLIKGKVEDTIPSEAPESVALLRLDTDWYSSTEHELFHLFPRVSKGGVIIIDDYGHWSGARKATDEYLSNNHVHALLHRIDYGAISLLKT